MDTPAHPTESPTGPPPRVSVLLVNFNGARWLAGCLDSLARCSGPSREVIVVDNASTDDSLALLARYPWVQVLRSEINRGFAGGNNLGLARCRGEFILLLNNDTVVTPGFIEPLVRHLETHPKVGIVQARMRLSRHGNVLDTCGSLFTGLGYLYHVGYWKPDGPDYQEARVVFTAKGACMMFRRSLVEQVGGFLFEERFFCYYEETDFCHRAWLAGFETHFVPGSVIDHLQGATAETTQHGGFVLGHYLRNQLFAHLSNLSGLSLVRILIPYLLMSLAAATAGFLTGRWVLVAAHVKALLFCLRNTSRIRERRRLQRAIRVQRDAAIFDRARHTPSPRYFWLTFRGRLAEYQDAPEVLRSTRVD